MGFFQDLFHFNTDVKTKKNVKTEVSGMQFGGERIGTLTSKQDQRDYSRTYTISPQYIYSGGSVSGVTGATTTTKKETTASEKPSLSFEKPTSLIGASTGGSGSSSLIPVAIIGAMGLIGYSFFSKGGK